MVESMDKKDMAVLANSGNKFLLDVYDMHSVMKRDISLHCKESAKAFVPIYYLGIYPDVYGTAATTSLQSPHAKDFRARAERPDNRQELVADGGQNDMQVYSQQAATRVSAEEVIYTCEGRHTHIQ